MKRTEMRRFSLSSCWSTPADSSSDKLSAASPSTLTACESVEARSLACNRKISLPAEVSFVEGGNFNGCIYDSMKNHSRSHDTKLSQQFPYPSSPPTIAESVTHSEFENLFQSNQLEQSANHDRKIATCVSLSESQESLLTDLVRNQLSVLSLCDDTDTLQQVITCLANGHEITDSDDEHVISLTSNKAIPAPTNVRQTYFKECFEPIHNSLPERNNSLPAKYCKNKETGPETIYKRWSVCERPNAGQVAQVKSAWEHYFNPSRRSSQASLKSSGMNGTCYSKLEASDKAKPNSSSQTNGENSTHGTLLHAPTNASRTYKAKEQRDAKVFSTIGSLDEFILMPASGLLATYFNHNRGDMKSTPYDLPCETDEPQRSISTDSVARISDISSSTITLSDNRTPTEEFPGTINSIALTELKTNMFGELLPVTQMQLEADTLQPHRSRNISTPAMTRRPLSITVQRHRIRASRSPTFTSPNQDWLSDPTQLLVKPLGNVIAQHAQQEVHTLAVQTAVRERPAGVEDRTFDQSEEAALFNQLPSISPTESAAKFTASRLRRRVTVHTYTGQANLGTTNGLSVDSGRHDFHSVPSPGTNEFRLSNGFRDNNVERHVRSLSATTVPKLNCEPQVLVQSTNIIRMQSTDCDADKASVAVQRANRCRGIYKKSLAQGQNADSISGLTKSSETIIEPAVVKATVLSSAAQRYEQHVQALVAKRHHDTQFSSLWQSKPFREEQADVKITPEDRRLLSDQQFGLQEPKLAYETVQAETDDMATTDPEAWQDKFGLITRWQYEVNNAMRARETDLDDLMPSSDSCSCSLNPPSDPSTIRNDNSALSGHPPPCLPPIYRTGEVISFLTPLQPYQIHAPTTNYQAIVHTPVEPTREYDNFPCEYRTGYGELTNSYQSDLQPSVGASPPFYKNGKFTKTVSVHLLFHFFVCCF
ncbi:hypothetical protein EG68_11484 [Paragonimus skrjabini miyazakii]|uniref:Uncharacterized protein n=1 Tax=Paragonimus skrjabini miyazakii TaxID=59628 RepID=A0A8S9YL37_9TREM|nr:hypothetical protein EG68_11484 [Paragonimus skrjabini miyazakii]